MSNNLILVYPTGINDTPVGDVSLALLYLAGAARDSGFCDNISIFDFNTPAAGKSVNDLIDAISLLPDGTTVVAINCLYSALFPLVNEIAKKLKEEFPSIKITIGGMHPTIYAKEIIENCHEIDSIAIGESDLEFPKLLQYYFSGKLVDLNGYYLRINDDILFYPKTNYIQNLDILPFPGYEFYNFNEYMTDTSNWWNPDNIEINPLVLPLLTSRSCPNMCNFCSMWLVMGNKFRQRSAENVFNEIKYLHDAATGMNVCAYFIIGMPEETEKTIKDTVDLINEIDFSRISITRSMWVQRQAG